MRQTVVDIDLVAYSDLARLLQEAGTVKSVAELNREINDTIVAGAKAVGVTLTATNYKNTGDGGLIFFSKAEEAHRFARQVHTAAGARNETKTTFAGKRHYRIGAATGEVEATAG